MLKMRKKIENRGMSLVEVIVSMLVLSIAVVTVMSAFSMASKTNLQAKKHQDVESLMESFLEYAEAGGTNFQGAFTVDAADYSFTDDGVVKVETLKNVKEGFGAYEVVVTTDTAPTEYTSTEFNNHSVIQFGGSNSNTVLIDASLEQNDVAPENNISDADEDACYHFWLWHSLAVEEFNQEQEAIKLSNPGHTYTPLSDVGMTAIYGMMDRELQITTVETAPDKMQLMAHLVYTVSGSLKLPDTMSRTYSILIYLSEEYDSGYVTTTGARKLDQVYVLYSKSTMETPGTGENIDIRILDTDGPNKRLNATIFLVEQTDSSMGVGTAVTKDSFMDRIGDPHRTLRVSFKNLTNGHVEAPKVKMYCSVNLDLESADANVTYDSTQNAYNLVAKGNEVRVVTVSVEIKDADTGVTLDTKEITRLQ